MYITGHTGLTLGIASLLNRGKPEMSYKDIALVMGAALMPDILDRLLHLIYQEFPDHSVFHSLFFYLIAIPLVSIFLRSGLPFFSIMAMNVSFDIVNVDPRAFLYPAFGWKTPFQGHAVPLLINPVMKFWPNALKYRFPYGHFLLFEAGGLIIIFAVFGSRVIRGAIHDRAVPEIKNAMPSVLNNSSLSSDLE